MRRSSSTVGLLTELFRRRKTVIRSKFPLAAAAATGLYSKELVSKFEWNANTGNIPAAYLTGFLAGTRAKKQNVQEAILDLGIFYHRIRVLAAFKGILQSGIEIPYNEDFFPDNMEEIITGSHIEQYANLL